LTLGLNFVKIYLHFGGGLVVKLSENYD